MLNYDRQSISPDTVSQNAETKEEGVTKIRIPITGVLIFGIAGMTFVAVTLALYLGFSGAIENTRALLYQRAERMIDNIVKDIGHQLDPIYRHATQLSTRVLSGDFDPQNAAQWEQVVSELPVTLPQVTGVAFIGTDLQGRIFNAHSTGAIGRDFSMLPRATKLFQRARESRKPQWLRPLWSPTVGQAIIPIAVPLYRGDRLIGIHVAVIALADFSKRITETMKGSGLTPFVLYDNNWLLVHPAIVDWTPAPTLVAGEMAFSRGQDVAFLPSIDTLSNEKISLFWQAKELLTLGDGESKETHISQYDENDEREFFVYRDHSRLGESDWIVGAHFSSDLLSPEIERLQKYGSLSIGVLILAVVSAAIIGALTSKPIRRLAAAARAAHTNDLESVPVLPTSAIREVDDASVSFNEMIVGLKERARIRNLFGKYLPESVAARLLDGDDSVAPQSAEATILFIDLEGFTRLSESLKPQQITDLLNEYFSTVVAIIERHRGVVTQFQGDAILATFNVPVSDPNHAGNAVKAAKEMYIAVSQRRFAGHQLAIRVGVNTGEVFAGNVGASDRLSYTVHGDAVNIAARLEAMNKELGTRILIGGSTAALVSDVSLRQISGATIRGKIEAVQVFEVCLES
jgi:adenylate cyclase